LDFRHGVVNNIRLEQRVEFLELSEATGDIGHIVNIDRADRRDGRKVDL
jgi:hypothetical protein